MILAINSSLLIYFKRFRNTGQITKLPNNYYSNSFPIGPGGAAVLLLIGLHSAGGSATGELSVDEYSVVSNSTARAMVQAIQ